MVVNLGHIMTIHIRVSPQTVVGAGGGINGYKKMLKELSVYQKPLTWKVVLLI